MDDLLLGLVDLVGTLRRDVRRPHLPRANDPRVRDRRGRGTDRLRLPVVRGRRRHRHRAAEEREGRHRRRPRHARALAVHGARRTPASSPQLGPVRRPDRPVLHQRCGCSLDRDGNHGHARLVGTGQAGRDRARGADGCHRLRDAPGGWSGCPATGGGARRGAVHLRGGRRRLVLDQGAARGDPTTRRGGPDGVAGVPLAKVPADTTETDRPEPGT